MDDLSKKIKNFSSFSKTERKKYFKVSKSKRESNEVDNDFEIFLYIFS